MLEGVLDVRKRGPFVDEFIGLQPRELAQQVVFRLINDVFEEAEREFFANDCECLQKCFFIGR